MQLYPMKTYIGKISHGFNFLAYYMDPDKILPSQETFRRFYERSAALYEPPPDRRRVSRRYKKNSHGRDISLYLVHEAPPTNEQLQRDMSALLARVRNRPVLLRRMQLYVGRWTRWLKLGLLMLEDFISSVETFLPCLFSCWSPGTTSFAEPFAAR